ncbi:MAG: N-6 DNA methylase [Candidatus Paceibacterota bacterium]|jgi:type I restriction enzyme M protein
MDIISLYKNRIDALMDILFGAGVSNPQTIIEQLNYLLFLRALSIKDDEAELLGITDESEKIFSGDLAKYRWQNLLALNAEDLFKTLETSFDLLQKKSKNPTVKLLFRNAHIKIFDKPTLRRVLHEIETFSKELDAIAHEGNKDVFGDMYEYLLSKLSSAGTNGQFRTPRHIIDFMVKVVDPKKNETMLDPACGTAGFLVAAYRYIAGEYTSDKLKKAGSPRAMDKLSADEKNFLFSHMFTGFDSDEDMIKFGMMNLHLHGLTKSRLIRQNSLTDTTGMKDKFDVILANPPFAGKIDEESVSEDLRMGTKATELLFLRFMMDRLSIKGKLAVIVPEGVVFNTSKAHTKIRQMMIEKGLWAVVSLPSGVFNPYAGVKTSLLFLDHEIAKTKKELLFVKIESDGFDLGAQRRPVESNDLPVALEVLHKWKIEGKADSDIASRVPKEDILKDPDLSLSADRYRVTTDLGNGKWPMVELGDQNFFDVVSGGTPSTSVPGYWGGDVMWATLVDLPADQLVSDLKETKRKITESGLKNSSAILLPPNSVIVSTRATIGRIAINQVPVATNQGFKNVILKSKEVDPSYVAFMLTKLVPQMQMQATGGTFKELSGSKFKKLSIPLPSLEEQKQIVAELDGYQKIIGGAKQVVENWKPRVEVDPLWEKVKLGNICEINPKKGEIKKLSVETEVSFVPMADLGQHATYFDAKQTKKLADVVGSYTYFAEGDVLLARVTPCFENGKAGIARHLRNKIGFGSSEYIVLRATEKILPEIIYAFVTDNDFMDRGKSMMTGTGGLQRIPVSFVENWEVHLPPLEIQNQIAEKINAERVSIETTAKLIPIFEQKTKDRLAKLWN